MNMLGNGLQGADHDKDALSVQEAQLSTYRRVGAPEEHILTMLTNLANSYANMGRLEQALQMDREVYRGRMKLDGEEDESTLRAANNFANSLHRLQHFEEARSLMRKTLPVARRVLGESNILTLKMRKTYARALQEDPAATRGDLREAVTALEDLAPTARRVLGIAHPVTKIIDFQLRSARATLRAREE